MCGRYVLRSTPEELQKLYEAEPEEGFYFKPSYNITPGRSLPVLLQHEGGRRLGLCRWGLIPSWAREEKTKYSMINARAETLESKPAYRDAYRRRRCIVPASGFYEWRKTPDGKQPYYLSPSDGSLFNLAGLYEIWNGEDKSIRSFTIVTTEANETVKPIHDRMPAILVGRELDLWLDPDLQETSKLAGILRPFSEDGVRYHTVSTRVNRPQNDSPDLIEKSALF